jgi:type I site-specific restriction endonuclease
MSGSLQTHHPIKFSEFQMFISIAKTDSRSSGEQQAGNAKRAFDGFLAGKTLTANQIHFVNLVIDYLTQSGWMSAARLYESPFTDFSPRGVEGVFDSVQLGQLLSVLDEVRQTAVA